MKNFKRVLSLALAVLMVIGGLVIAPVDAKAETTYTKVTSLSELTEGTKFVIVATKGTKYYVAGTATSNGYTPVEASLSDLSKAATFEVTAITDGKYSIKSAAGYIKAKTKNTMSFDATASSAWEIKPDATGGTFQFYDAATSYYIVLNGTNYLRCYVDKSTTSGYVQSWSIYKLVEGEGGGTTPETPVEPEVPAEPELGTIAEALAAADNTLCKVKGVVTHLESTANGSNIYVQDATGAICLRTSGAVTDIVLGDTVEAKGSKTVYQGVPQLGSASYTKASGLTLEAKTTTIGALAAADICTYVKLTGLTVTEVYDNNGQYSNPNITVKDAEGKTIQLYKAVIEKVDGEWSVKAGDVIDVLAAASFYSKNGTEKFQLRNTLASEITKVVTEPEQPETPEVPEQPEDPEVPEEPKDEMTAEEILAEAAKLADGAYLGGSKDVKFTLKGVITEFTFNEQYGDANLTIKVDGTDETFYCYQVKGDAVKDLKVGSHIELNGAIKNYQGTIEFERPNLVSVIATGDFSMALPLVLVLMGGAAVIVASKKRFA